MTPNEMVSYLETKGYKLTRLTILRYEEIGMLPEPERGGLGRGRGRYTNYPEGAEHEAVAALQLMEKGYKRVEVAAARAEALDLLHTFFINHINIFPMRDGVTDIFTTGKKPVLDWIVAWAKAKENIPFDSDIIIEVKGSRGKTGGDIFVYDVLKEPKPAYMFDDKMFFRLVPLFNKYGPMIIFIDNQTDKGYGYFDPECATFFTN